MKSRRGRGAQRPHIFGCITPFYTLKNRRRPARISKADDTQGTRAMLQSNQASAIDTCPSAFDPAKADQLRIERELDAALAALWRRIDPRSWVNGIVCLVACLNFGVQWWLAILVGIIVFVASRFSYGRRIFTRGGIALLILVLLDWTGALAKLASVPPLAKCFF